MTVKIMVVEDEARMRDLIKMYMQKEGYQVVEAGNGKEALTKLEKQKFDLIILDLMMPEMDGLTVCKEIRKKSDVPIIMVTAKGEEFDKVLGFELGADDYVVKPFGMRELVARVRALLRRAGEAAKRSDAMDTKEIIEYPGLKIKLVSRQVRINEQELILTPKEYDLLVYFAKNPDKVFTREQLLEFVWGYDFFGDLRTVDTHVKKIREKLRNCGETHYINTVWGVGYKFEVGQWS
jgi:two-component system response regulator ResD